LFEAWRISGWITVDAGEGVFRLCPGNLPGWADASKALKTEGRAQNILPLTSDNDLHKEVAKISQADCGNSATFGEVAKISQPPGGVGGAFSIDPDHSNLDPDRVDSNRNLNSNSIRSKDSEANIVQKVQEVAKISQPSYGSELGYIEDKLCLPKMQRLRIEITGGNPHMTRKFLDLLHLKPGQLAEWMGEAASPAINDPCKFMNEKMSHALRP